MRVAPVSADLLIKLALAAGAIGVAWYAWRKMTAKAEELAAVGASVWTGASSVADAVIAAPYEGYNLIVSAVTGREETLGGWLYDVTHPDPVNPMQAPQDLIVSKVTGREETLGGWLYDVTHPDPVNPTPKASPPSMNGTDYNVPGLPDYFAA